MTYDDILDRLDACGAKRAAGWATTTDTTPRRAIQPNN